MDKNRPFRYTKHKLSYETTYVLILLMALWKAFTWGFRRMKPLAYHPIGMLGAAGYRRGRGASGSGHRSAAIAARGEREARHGGKGYCRQPSSGHWSSSGTR